MKPLPKDLSAHAVEPSRSKDFLAALEHVSSLLVTLHDDPTLLKHILEFVRETCDFECVTLWLKSSDSRALGLEMAFTAKRHGTLDLNFSSQSQTDLLKRALETGDPIIEDCDYLAPQSEKDAEPTPATLIAIPLQVGKQTFGILEVQKRKWGAVDFGSVTVSRIIAAQLAMFLANTHSIREDHRQVETLHALYEISLDITSTLERERVLSTILEKAAHLLQAQTSTVGIYDPVKQVLRKIAVHNLPSQVQGIELQIGEGVGGQVMATRGPVIVRNYLQWEERSPQFQEPRLSAMLGVPLRWEGQVIGTLDVSDDGNRRQFNEDDARLLGLFADLASIAYKNAELFDRVRQLSRELESKVEERTLELVNAQQEISRNAAQLQQLLIATVSVQEQERSRIAQDLHDGSNQLITGALFELQAARLSLTNNRTEAAHQRIETVKRLLQQVEAENRRIILDLRPPILDAQGLEPAVRWQARTLQESHALTFDMQTDGQPVRLPPIIETAVYRIVQESLNNVVAHSHSLHVRIHLNFYAASLLVDICDVGVGFEPAKIYEDAHNQMGLIGMRERARSIGGQLTIESAPGQGTRITLMVPLVSSQVQSQDN